MEPEGKGSIQGDEQPFEIVHNARKNSKHLKSTASKSRKNSTVSLAEDKHKKIKKRVRKLTDWVEDSQHEKSLEEALGSQALGEQTSNNIFMQSFLQYQMKGQQKQAQGMGQGWKEGERERQEEQFRFEDGEGEKGIMEGIGDENSEREFRFDFFNPEKFSRGRG